MKQSQAQSWWFDFGTPTSPVSAGFVRTTPAITYRPDQGFGWLSGLVDSRDRGVGSDLTCDLNFTRDATFAVDVPGGRYDVTITLGDATFARTGMNVSLEGSVVDSVTTSRGRFAARTYRVTVADGQLTLRLVAAEGTGSLVTINGLIVRASTGLVMQPSADPPQQVRDLTTSRSTLLVSNIGVAATDFRVGLDISHTFDSDLEVTLLAPDGARVRLASGVGGGGDDFDGTVFADDTVVAIADGSPPFAGTYRPEQQLSSLNGRAPDGQWVLEVTDVAAWDTGVLNGWWISFEVPCRAPCRLFDFGTPVSPIAAGYTGVDPTTRYTASQGYGWLAGAVYTRDRASGSDLVRDFDFTRDATFGVDLPSGVYDISAVQGDASFARAGMEVFVEGTQVDTVNTAPNRFSKKTFRFKVEDGQLTVRFRVPAGTDAWAMVNALEIATVADP